MTILENPTPKNPDLYIVRNQSSKIHLPYTTFHKNSQVKSTRTLTTFLFRPYTILMETLPLKPSQIPNKLQEYDLAIGEQLNAGLLLKKDQGFHMLNVFQKLFMMSYLYDERDKARAFVQTSTKYEWDNLDGDEKLKYKVIANAEWKKIENIMGGVRNMITMMGVDAVEIIRKTRQLMKARKMSIDKDGVEHFVEDGSTQMKATEFLAKISGNYSEELENINRTTINLNFGTNQPAKPEDLLSDNMEVIEGVSVVVNEEN